MCAPHTTGDLVTETVEDHGIDHHDVRVTVVMSGGVKRIEKRGEREKERNVKNENGNG